MTKLKLMHIKPYLEHGLKIKSGKDIFEVTALSQDNVYFDGGLLSMEDVKPILRPLSDLLIGEDFLGIQNLIRVHIGKTKLQKMCSDGYGLIDLPWFITEYLFEKHFDFFDLIEKDLAENINFV